MSTSRFGLHADIADEEHAAGVAVPAVDDDGHVDIDDVAVLQALGTGNAVADDMIDADARRMAVAAVEDGGGHGTAVEHEIADHFIEIDSQRFGHYVRHQHVERFGGQPSGSAHPGERGGIVQADTLRALVKVGIIFGNVHPSIIGTRRRLRNIATLPTRARLG
jgi:hypothetical protein